MDWLRGAAVLKELHRSTSDPRAYWMDDLRTVERKLVGNGDPYEVGTRRTVVVSVDWKWLRCRWVQRYCRKNSHQTLLISSSKHIRSQTLRGQTVLLLIMERMIPVGCNKA